MNHSSAGGTQHSSALPVESSSLEGTSQDRCVRPVPALDTQVQGNSRLAPKQGKWMRQSIVARLGAVVVAVISCASGMHNSVRERALFAPWAEEK